MAQAQLGMFGMTPLDAEMMRRRDIMESAKGVEEYGPSFAAGTIMQQGIGNLGRAFGIRDQYDQQVDKTTQVKQWLKENLPENPDPIQYYEKMAEAFNRFGMPEQAAQVMLKVDDLKNNDVDRKHKLSDIGYNNMQARSNAIRAEASMIEALDKANLKPSDLKTIAETIKNNPDARKFYESNPRYEGIKEFISNVRTGPDWSQPYLIPGTEGKQVLVQKNLLSGEVEAIDKSTKLAVTNNLERERGGFEVLSSQEAKALSDGFVEKQKNVDGIRRIDTMIDQVENTELFGGAGANNMMMFSRILDMAGLLSKRMEQILSSSETFDANSKALVLVELGGSLGVQISDADRKFIESIVPRLSSDPTARKELLNFMKWRLEEKNKDYDSVVNWAGKKGRIYDAPSRETKPYEFKYLKKPPSMMSDDELIKQYGSREAAAQALREEAARLRGSK